MVAVRAPFTPEARRALNRADSGIDAYWTPARMRLADILARPTGGRDKSTSTRYPRASSVGRMVGKIFYRNAANGRDYSCSGWVVHTGSGNLVGTAGHCVYDARSGWHQNWVFVPAFDHGRRPYGIWRAAWMITFRGWVKHAQSNRDVAFVKVLPSGGKNLVDVVGGYRIRTGFPSQKRRLTIIGYPFLAPYPGDRQYRCAGVASPTGPRLQLPCRLTTGASGGPWVEGNASTGTGYVDGITTNTNLANTMLWSPPFDDGVRDLYHYADLR
jgi:V8-like Glu-specific endopeptidase